MSSEAAGEGAGASLALVRLLGGPLGCYAGLQMKGHVFLARRLPARRQPASGPAKPKCRYISLIRKLSAAPTGMRMSADFRRARGCPLGGANPITFEWALVALAPRSSRAGGDDEMKLLPQTNNNTISRTGNNLDDIVRAHILTTAGPAPAARHPIAAAPATN